MTKKKGLCLSYEVSSCLLGVFSYGCGGSKGKGEGFDVGVVLIFCGSLFSFYFLLSWCSFCILHVYLKAPHVFFYKI
jgi:hypothetical protein